MRESENPENHEWARSMVQRLVRRFPLQRSDIEAEALLGLVRAEAHPRNPGGEDFQKFAYKFVWRAAKDFTQGHRRQLWKSWPLAWFSDFADHRTTHEIPEYSEIRRLIAARLEGFQRTIFLAIYGEDACAPLSRVADETGLSLDQVKRLHGAAMEVARDLPAIHAFA